MTQLLHLRHLNFFPPLRHSETSPKPTISTQLKKRLSAESSAAAAPSSHFFSGHQLSVPKHPHLALCSQDDLFSEKSSTQFPGIEQPVEESEGLELRDKPSPSPPPVGTPSEGDDDSIPPEDEAQKRRDEALAPFLKFFKPRDASGEIIEGEDVEIGESKDEIKIENGVSVEYYDPKPGEFVVGVVVSGNENKLDVNVGADLLGTMLTKEVLPLCKKDMMDDMLCDLDGEGFRPVKGRVGIVRNEAALSGGSGGGGFGGRPVVETGTVLFAEVLGRTLSGRPLLSTRRVFRRVAWSRVRQIKELNEPIEVKITEWNTGGLLTRIEGLRAFLPKMELVQRVSNFKELKENVGRRMNVLITRVNENNNDLVLSEKDAWEMVTLKEGTLLEGTVKAIFPYGAQVQIGESNRSGLLHVSKISKTRVTAVDGVLEIDEKVKALIVKSMFPGKISLSTADLESEPGLILSDKERVFAEAEEMAKKYRQKLPAAPKGPKHSGKLLTDPTTFDQDSVEYANWKWFKFENNNEAE